MGWGVEGGGRGACQIKDLPDLRGFQKRGIDKGVFHFQTIPG